MTLPILPTPLATPLGADERIDEVAFRRLVDHVLDGGCDALFVLSTTGEFAGLTDRERLRAVELTVDAAAGRAPVWAGVGDTTTGRVLAHVDALRDAGVAALVLCAPFYQTDLTQADLERHVHAVAARAGVPLILYNIPQTTHFTIETATVARLAGDQAIAGVKDSSGDFTAFQRLIEIGAARPDFAVYQGAERLAAASLLAGGHGLMSGMGNLAPALLKGLHAACRNRDVAMAHAMQRRLTRLSEAVSSDFWLRGIKAALELLDIGTARVLAPWSSELSEDVRHEIATALAEALESRTDEPLRA